MAEVYHVDGYVEFVEKILEIEKTSEVVYAYFTGKKDEEGNSWCPDCNEGKLNKCRSCSVY